VRPVVCIVTPGTRDANNGNWRTAVRWARMLGDRYRVIVHTAWGGERADLLLALHARRSAGSIAAFRAESPAPIALVLTGTDLYRDLAAGGETLRSLEIADRLVVLQDDALGHLEPAMRRKCDVVYQSARPIPHRARHRAGLSCAVVGHLRAEKDPETLLAALRMLPGDLPIRVRHVGAPLDGALAKAARAFAARDPRYRFLGPLPHGLARTAIASADMLVHPSIMEGGANVVVEAVTSGTPVIASRVSGNVGMLGREYPGFFEARDAAGLAALLERACRDAAFVRALREACNRRKPLFRPAAEARAIRAVVARLLA
jgi:putative glycosyltransferase (TIGR04348 family)